MQKEHLWVGRSKGATPAGAEGGQLKVRHTATSVSQVGWAGVKWLLLRAEGGQF